MPTWSPSLAIGVPEIDDQHRTLFERAGRFAAAVHGHERNARLEELFDFLAEYALEHFASEERLGSLVPQWDSEGGSQAGGSGSGPKKMRTSRSLPRTRASSAVVT